MSSGARQGVGEIIGRCRAPLLRNKQHREDALNNPAGMVLNQYTAATWADFDRREISFPKEEEKSRPASASPHKTRGTAPRTIGDLISRIGIRVENQQELV